MPLDPDDPRLTAYALGELPPDECAAIEAELEHNPECRQAVAEIRDAARRLKEDLAAEVCPAPSPDLKRVLEARLERPKVIPFPRPRRFAAVALTTMAASIALVLAWHFWRAMSPAGHAKQLAALANADQLKYQKRSLPSATSLPPTQQVNQLIRVSENKFVSVRPATVPGPSGTPSGVPEIWSPDLVSKNAEEAQPIASIPSSPKPALFPPTVPNGPASLPPAVTVWSDTAGGASQPSFPSSQAVPIQSQASPGRMLFETPPRGNASGFGGGGQGRLSAGNSGYAQTLAKVDHGPAFPSDNMGIQPFPVPQMRQYWPHPQPTSVPASTATYPKLVENTFHNALDQPLSTFSLDVDTASYANIRRFLNADRLPPSDAVRIEEMINYFPYQYAPAKGEEPFSVNLEVAGCPWNTDHRLVRVALRGRDIPSDKRPAGNYVFLIDVSGSMEPPERLPLIKQAMRQLVKKLSSRDRVAIVVYANEAGVRLASTSCSRKEEILAAIDALSADGSTNGGDGIQQAYRVAVDNFIKGGVNRVLLCTDGDFNVGITDENELLGMIKQKARTGVFLTTLGVGTDNYKDALMQKLADTGNGNYYYLDTLEEAQKALLEQMNGTLVTVAKDVKAQVEFNPSRVDAYRLIGYEKRALRNEDFNDDAKDAGEIGAGHTVTALYEIVPSGGDIHGAVDPLKYQQPATRAERPVLTGSSELLTLKLRYKLPDGDQSRRIEFPLTDHGGSFENASADFRFAASVASFGMMLRDSEFKGSTGYDSLLEMAAAARGDDEGGYRAEFLNLVRKAKSLQ